MEQDEWRGRVGESWAAEWRRTDRSFGQLTERLLARSRDFSFAQVADIGCGAGELSLALARGRPGVNVTGVDISPQLLAAARERAGNLANVRFELADAGQWQAVTSPDMLVSRHGVMFFADPPAAFAHLAGQAAAGARLLFSCFREVADNPFFTEVMRLLPEASPPPDADAPGPFAFADSDRVTVILRAGGWENLQFERFDFPMVAGAGADPVEEAVAYFSRIGPAAKALSQMPALSRDRFLDRVRDLAGRYCREGVVSLPASVWLVTGSKV